jgi:hypothetical protein
MRIRNRRKTQLPPKPGPKKPPIIIPLSLILLLSIAVAEHYEEQDKTQVAP